MRHLTEEDLILLYYNEPGVREDAPEHLRTCAECRAASESLALTLNVCSEWTVPEPDAAFGRSVWAQIAPQLEHRRVAGWRLRRLWAVPVVMAVLLCTFYLGRVSKHPESPVLAGLSDAARQRILAISLADHLDRAKMLLTEISNTDADAQSVRSRAQDMVDEGRLMRQSLAGQGDTATLELVDELERFLLEAANLDNPGRLDGLRQRIDSGSLLFKVRIIESNLRTEGQKS